MKTAAVADGLPSAAPAPAPASSSSSSASSSAAAPGRKGKGKGKPTRSISAGQKQPSPAAASASEAAAAAPGFLSSGAGKGVLYPETDGDGHASGHIVLPWLPDELHEQLDNDADEVEVEHTQTDPKEKQGCLSANFSVVVGHDGTGLSLLGANGSHHAVQLVGQRPSDVMMVVRDSNTGLATVGRVSHTGSFKDSNANLATVAGSVPKALQSTTSGKPIRARGNPSSSSAHAAAAESTERKVAQETAEAKKRKVGTRKPNGACKCGSFSHKRITHKDCPENPKATKAASPTPSGTSTKRNASQKAVDGHELRSVDASSSFASFTPPNSAAAATETDSGDPGSAVPAAPAKKEKKKGKDTSTGRSRLVSAVTKGTGRKRKMSTSEFFAEIREAKLKRQEEDKAKGLASGLNVEAPNASGGLEAGFSNSASARAASNQQQQSSSNQVYDTTSEIISSPIFAIRTTKRSRKQRVTSGNPAAAAAGDAVLPPSPVAAVLAATRKVPAADLAQREPVVSPSRKKIEGQEAEEEEDEDLIDVKPEHVNEQPLSQQRAVGSSLPKVSAVPMVSAKSMPILQVPSRAKTKKKTNGRDVAGKTKVTSTSFSDQQQPPSKTSANGNKASAGGAARTSAQKVNTTVMMKSSSSSNGSSSSSSSSKASANVSISSTKSQKDVGLQRFSATAPAVPTYVRKSHAGLRFEKKLALQFEAAASVIDQELQYLHSQHAAATTDGDVDLAAAFEDEMQRIHKISSERYAWLVKQCDLLDPE